MMLASHHVTSTNTTVFSDSVVSALNTLQPGILRYWGTNNGQLGETLDNLLTDQFGRQQAAYLGNAYPYPSSDIGLHDFLVLCQTINAEPWIVVPSTFSTTDATHLIDYLAGDNTSTYGAKRIALGQTTPWTSEFTTIHLEFGSQEWNNMFLGGSILTPEIYGARAQTIFAAMMTSTFYTGSASKFDLVLGGEAGSPTTNSTIQSNCNNNTSFDVAPYMMNTINTNTSTEDLYGPTFAEPEALMSATSTAELSSGSGGEVYQDYLGTQSATHVVPLSVSEINVNPFLGSVDTGSYAGSLGAGLAVTDAMLQGLKQYGIVNQNLNALVGYQTTANSKTAPLPGAVVSTNPLQPRPQYLALELANTALVSGASELETVHTGADPTWSQAYENGVYQYAAHDLQSYAFSNGTTLSLIVFNLSRTDRQTVTFSGPYAPVDNSTMYQLTSTNVTDTNETANTIQIATSTY